MPALQPVVAERALPGAAVVLAPVDDAERAGRRRSSRSRCRRRAGRRPSRTRCGRWRRSDRPRGSRRARSACRRRTPSATACPRWSPPHRRPRAPGGGLLHEGHVPPGRRAEVAGVVVRVIPVKRNPSSGSWFHCLHATSQALQPMQSVVSVKNPFARGHQRGSSPVGIGRAVAADLRAGLSAGRRPRAARAGLGVGHRGAGRCRVRPGWMSPVSALRLLDRDVRIGDEREELVGARRRSPAHRAPVVRHADGVDRAARRIRSGRIRAVTRTRASISPRAVRTVAQPPLRSPAPRPARARPRRTSPAAARRATRATGSSRRRCGAR